MEFTIDLLVHSKQLQSLLPNEEKKGKEKNDMEYLLKLKKAFVCATVTAGVFLRRKHAFIYATFRMLDLTNFVPCKFTNHAVLMNIRDCVQLLI